MAEVSNIPTDLIGEAARHAAILVHDSNAQQFTPRFGGSLEQHTIGKIGEYLFWEEVKKAQIHIRSKPMRENYTKLYPGDDFVLVVDGKDIRVEVKTANVFAPLCSLPTGFRFMLNATQKLAWDFVVSIFVNLTDLTYRIMGCMEREHIDVYPITGSGGVRHYEIPPEFLLPIECIWEDCSWKDA
jgi:hypothetical protein